MTSTRERRKTEWAKRLKILRKRLGLSQQQAADKLEVPVATWRNWEYGRNQPNDGMARIMVIVFPDV